MSTKLKKSVVIDGEEYVKAPKGRTTFVNVILDMSGSMMDVWDATIDSYNEYINGLKATGGKFKVSLTVFDTVNEHPYTALDLNKVPKLTRDIYAPRGGTALYDAVCTTLNEVKYKLTRLDKALAVIITDGGENSSHEFSEKQFIALKDQLEEQGNWSFVYLGANQNAWDTAHQWGFNKQNVSSFNASAAGLRSVSSNLAKSTGIFAASASMNTTNFMSVEQQDELKETK